MKKILFLSYKHKAFGKNKRGGYSYQNGGVWLLKRGDTTIIKGDMRSGFLKLFALANSKKKLAYITQSRAMPQKMRSMII